MQRSAVAYELNVLGIAELIEFVRSKHGSGQVRQRQHNELCNCADNEGRMCETIPKQTSKHNDTHMTSSDTHSANRIFSCSASVVNLIPELGCCDLELLVDGNRCELAPKCQQNVAVAQVATDGHSDDVTDVKERHEGQQKASRAAC